MTLILVTNDDGVQAAGLQILSNEAQKLGRPVIIAPDRNNSAASHSLTMNRPLRVKELQKDVFSIDGTPTDCVTIGIGKILAQKPDLVISGINPGANLGDDVSYSGTVSAAIEATMLGIPSIALSLASSATGPLYYETAAAFGVKLAGLVLERGLPHAIDPRDLEQRCPGFRHLLSIRQAIRRGKKTRGVGCSASPLYGTPTRGPQTPPPPRG